MTLFGCVYKTQVLDVTGYYVDTKYNNQKLVLFAENETQALLRAQEILKQKSRTPYRYVLNGDIMRADFICFEDTSDGQVVMIGDI